jgi:hypothetical protein
MFIGIKDRKQKSFWGKISGSWGENQLFIGSNDILAKSNKQPPCQ